jgi:hypothetical protein
MSAIRRAVSGAQLGRDLAAGDVLDQLLAGPGRHRPVGDEGGDERLDLGIDRVGRRHLVGEAHRLGLGGAEALGGDEVAPRRLLAHRPHDVGADRRRQETEPGLAEREVHALGDDPDVADRGDAEPAGVAVAVDASDHRHRAGVKRPQHLGEGLGVAAVLLPV